ncbi:hypothetical protein QEN19_001688 [Hanseniaspora menglaensis]
MSLLNSVNGLSLPCKPVQLPDKELYEIEEKDHKSVLRLVTFNVNAVSTVLQYYPMTKIAAGVRNLNSFFNWMEADVICLQELKICNPILPTANINTLSGTKLLQQHGILSDYRCFITLPKLKKNYSGVGIYVKKLLPIEVVKVEEGITGFLPVNNISVNDYKIIENSSNKYLTLKHLNKNNLEIDSYRTNCDMSIGGYEKLDTIYDGNVKRALELDSQGRCIITEFNNGLIVIGSYIPANSQFTEEGLLFKMQYLKLIFQRIENLQNLGKTVILMGDLNVCKDIIDKEESLQLASKYFSNSTADDIDPQLNYEFIKEKPERFFFNQQLSNSNFKIESNYRGNMLDSTRYKHPIRKKMYTCWNTLTNSRSINFGARLDYILISKNYKKQKTKILNSNILPEIQGSDHCPVFADFEIQLKLGNFGKEKVIKFECKNFYKLINNDIMKMFGTKRSATQATLENKLSNKNKVTKWNPPVSKTGIRIDGFFKKRAADNNNSVDSNTNKELLNGSHSFVNNASNILDSNFVVHDFSDDDNDFLPRINSQTPPPIQRKDFIQQKLDSIRTDAKVCKQIQLQKSGGNESLFVCEEEEYIGTATEKCHNEDEVKKKRLKEFLSSSGGLYQTIPLCKHNEKAIIKVSQTKGVNKGKKFWCCNKPLVISDINTRNSSKIVTTEYSCGFFKWVN